MPPFISVKLQPCQPDLPLIWGNIPISTQGLVVCSRDWTKTNPGSPNCFTDSIILWNCSSLASSRTITAELLDLPLWGLSTNQLPVLAFIISSSSAENKHIVADLRTPPDNTASAACIAISYTCIGFTGWGSFESSTIPWRRYSILSSDLLNPSGPGALKPPDILAPFGLICVRSKNTLRPSYSGYFPPPTKNEDMRTSNADAQPSIESSTINPFACFVLFCILGSFATWCFCTEKPAPAPHNSI